jgi:hypothetical protein
VGLKGLAREAIALNARSTVRVQRTRKVRAKKRRKGKHGASCGAIPANVWERSVGQ